MKRNKSCKTICTAMAAVTLVAMLAGCNSEDPKKPVASVQESVAASESTGPSVPAPSVPDTSEPNVPAPSVPDVPAPSVPDNPGPGPSVPDDIHVHVYSEDVTHVTCTTDGFTTYTCACGDSYIGEIVDSIGHDWSDWVTVQEPTEEATGTAESVCAGCGAVKSKVLDKLIPNHTHSYTGEITKAATCTAEGVKTFTCSCGSSYSEEIDKISHSYGKSVTAPTCTQRGYTTYTCSACGGSYKDDYVNAKGHSFGGYQSNGDATCTKDGTKTGSCSACGAKDTLIDAGSAKGHSYSKSVTAPTCTEKGFTTNKCDACGDTFVDSYVDATGHNFGEYKSNGDATCTKDGTKTGSCSACGVKDTKSDTGSAKGHSYSKSVTAPTCTAKGFTTNKCNACGDTYKDSYVNATGHKYDSYTSNGDATCTKDGTKTATCSNGCGTKDTKTDVGSALGHNHSKESVVNPTLWSTGYTVYACGRCSDSYKADYRELTAEEKSDFLRAVEAAVVKYVNQFREEQSDIPATALPGMQKVAQYRAVQLSANFAHDEADIQDALLHYQYGKWIDNTAFGGRKYFSANSTEAIAYTPASHYYDADIIGYDIANQIRNSPGHWSYVGASRLPYIAVGTWVMEHDGVSFGGFYTCIMLISTDEFE